MTMPESPLPIPEMIPIPAGTFVMGSRENDRFANDTERPAHEVCVASFLLGKHPVTVAQYRCYQPAHATDQNLGCPVVNVSWIDAQDYCSWLGSATQQSYRLPSEAEWEYACRAGTTTAFHTGDDITIIKANFLFDEQGTRIGESFPTPVGMYEANAFGLHDMHGNVCEWVEDHWHPGYDSAPQDGTAWRAAQSEHVIRGGAWDYLPRLLRSAWRDHLPASSKRDNVGFRIALNPLPPSPART